MKRIVSGVITISLIIIMIIFVNTTIGNIDETKNITNEKMQKVWNTTTDTYTNITMGLLIPMTFILGISLLIYSIRNLAKKL